MKEYSKKFRNILRRMKLESNREKYNSICVRASNEDEERIWELCEKFWPKEYNDKNGDIDKYVVNDCLDEKMPQRYVAELEDLLDRQRWKR